MVFLARLILKGPSQAALIVATLAILGVLLIPAVWMSAAAIALIALVKDQRQTMFVVAIATAGTMVFASMIFATPAMAIYFLLVAWLPAWGAALVLRRTTLATSLQFITGLSLVLIIGLYSFFPEMGEIWREPLDKLVQQIMDQSQGGIELAQLQEIEELAIKMIPGFLACSVLLGTMISLFWARWWQSVILNPGGFAEEYQALNLGKTMAMVATAIMVAAALLASEIVYSMLLIILTLYTIQGLSILHAVFKGRQLNRVWLYFIYLVMFISPEVAAMLILAGIADAWIDFRRRLITK